MRSNHLVGLCCVIGAIYLMAQHQAPGDGWGWLLLVAVFCL